ncbi:sensor histidine kinase [Pararhizobium antarcticum]|uniref:histidine kinase n=1 Tax=Pararhizobium antarcticum TaxID=1798805 RepID=A0A657LRV3_9HYPH|nr:sensor histidine kinase [Pararhizobium antarcticum]OJF95062.1 histidine kinase [Pararhizobium antarcticum]OJF98116.1 histidine kinase [Rhizobium sp. 58]
MNEAQNRQGPRTSGRLRDFLQLARQRRFSFYLALLLLVAIVPSFIFSMVILKRSSDAQEQVVASLLKASTGSATRIIEREVEGMLTTLRVLSMTGSGDAHDLPSLYQRAFSALAGTDSNLLVIDRSYNQLFNTRVPFGTPLRKSSDPKSVDEAFAKDGPLISNVFFGNTAKKWVYNVYLPLNAPNGKTDYLLTLTQDAESMAKAVNRDTLSPGWDAALIDGVGNVIVSSDTKVAVGKPFFMEIVPALQIGIGRATHDGVIYRTVTEFSVATGWRVVAWAKNSDVDAPARWSYLWLTIGGVVFAGIALAGSAAIARILSRGIKQLARDAHLLGLGRPIPARRHLISELEVVSTALAEAAQSRAKAENEIRFLMREVAHRSKNQLTVIQSMLNQSLNAAENPTDFADAFRKRIAGLARSTDLMIANAAQGVDLRELVQNQLQPFTPDDPSRVRLYGPAVKLDTQVSQTLGMALHELATNATKYGALANSKGVVALDWSLTSTQLLIVWRESGADLNPETQAPVRKGFGTMVLERMLGMALDAKLERQMHRDGIEWRVTIPRDRLYAYPVADAD